EGLRGRRRRDTDGSPAAIGCGERADPPGRAGASHARRSVPAAHGTADAGRGSEADVTFIWQAEAVEWRRMLDTHSGSSRGRGTWKRAAESLPRSGSSPGAA